MTKSTITRERLAKIKSWRETYGAGSNVMLPAEEAEELARMALAAMDSEPVAYIFKHPAGRLFWSLTDKSNKGHDDVMPVYASPQPAPIVEREPIAWLNDAYLARGVVDGEAGSEDAGPGYIPVYRHAQPAPVVPAVSDDIGEIRVGRLPTMNQDDYPGLGDWWVQLRIGEDSDEVLARVYGAAPQEANNRAEALACRAAMLSGGKS
ncbi:hypothetical protein ACKLI6_04570 [Klebsiella quasipneumoniae subsp. similipneumoniae]|uniref:hypothetical protein n=1 Tax=Klebsiella pneumoniae complex TaxID=3390273 RepID=UPI00081BEF65|nr:MULTISPECIES: hypothetical protein [Klebsiella]MCA5572069.1 hypothetical protein [Klebsiella pneumoniae]MCJ7323334.1 hypothetical protein [Klebsiella quasipneumoniae]MDZ0692120.1 hypothetical protein [Klebsiella quasipneumoniae]OCV64398.1 hypothetical protein A9P91_15015 [Klebsiella quasipneumoniae subsp. similipneumoniae]OVU14340.1 hypothetical protein BMD96_11620 [Klebsiella quasipneumoniae subsp. similipneumoniae]